MKLECPHPNCPDVFYDVHDESAITALIYHFNKDHPALYDALKEKLCGEFDKPDAEGR